MTNGEKIEEIFPNIEIGPNPYSPSVDIYVGGVMMMRVDRNWWDAKYKEPRWIPVSERLPKNDDCYLVTEKSGRVCTYVFHKEGNSEEYWKRCAVAWMPLPKSYSEVEE